MVVTPPAAAALVAVQKPSQVVRPGSFTWTWQSTMPGITTLSPTSNTYNHKWVTSVQTAWSIKHLSAKTVLNQCICHYDLTNNIIFHWRSLYIHFNSTRESMLNWVQSEPAYLTADILRKLAVWEYLMDFPILYYDDSRKDLVANQYSLTPHSTNCFSELHVCLYQVLMSTINSPNCATLQISSWQFSGLVLRHHPLLNRISKLLTLLVCVTGWISDQIMCTSVGDRLICFQKGQQREYLRFNSGPEPMLVTLEYTIWTQKQHVVG